MANCGNCGKKFHFAKVFTVQKKRDISGYHIPIMDVCEDCYNDLKEFGEIY